MNVVIIDKEKYIFFDGDMPEVQEKLQEISEIIENLKNASNEEVEETVEKKTKVKLETVDSEVMVSPKDIISIEVYRNNCTVYTTGSVYKLKRGALENILKGIGDRYIVRCHKSYGINVRWLEGWKKKELFLSIFDVLHFPFMSLFSI